MPCEKQSKICDDQSKTCDFLSSMTTHGPLLQHLNTHISDVFIYADRVFKLKRAVVFDYLDFSTPEIRLSFCRREVELNRRTAPKIYLGARSITRKSDGGLELDGAGPLVDAFVEMRPFEQSDLLSVRLKDGKLDAATLEELAHVVAGFHQGAEPLHNLSGHESLAASVSINEAAFQKTSLARDERVVALLAQTRSALDAAGAALDARSRAGSMRQCHGDLHLRNICIYEGVPTLFDCIEFDDRLSQIDVLFDLAFLLMDVVQAGHPEKANLVFNRYLDETQDSAALGLMSLFMAVRATVRAQIAATRADAPDETAGRRSALREEAMSYVELALSCLHPQPRCLIAVGGLSGSGKSTLAAHLAPHVGAAPGARILASDRIRKALFGVSARERLPKEAYTSEISARVYARQRELAREALAGGASVVADAVFLRQEERKAIADMTRSCSAAFLGLWLDAPDEALKSRVTARVNDPSDATAAVVDQQLQWRGDGVEWTHVDASGGWRQTSAQAMQIAGLRDDDAVAEPLEN